MIKSTIYGIQNKEPKREDVEKAFYQLMEKFDNLKNIVKPGDTVLLKPNFVAPSTFATTDLVLIECMIQLVLDCGGIPIVGESSGFEFSTEGTFSILKIEELCKKYKVRLINFDNEKFVEIKSGNPLVPIYLIPEIVTQVDKIIDMPCLKGHSLTKVTFGIKNLFGIIHRNTRRAIHATDLNRGIVELAKLIKVDFVLVDGLWNLVNAVFSDTFYQGILLAGTDVAAVDRVCCDIFGVKSEDIPHIAEVSIKEEYEFVAITDIEKYDNHLAERAEHFVKQNKKYKLIYQVDKILYDIFHVSIIPYCHFFLGIRPHINKGKCIDCKKCHYVCPVNAISNKKIDIKKCMKIRCFRCFDVCECNAIEKRGFHK